MPRRVPFRVVYCSGADDGHSAKNLEVPNPATKGWLSPRLCPWPQEIILKFEGVTRLRRVQLLSHQSHISTKVALSVGEAREDGKTLSDVKFHKLGHVRFSANNESGHQSRELKAVHVDAVAQYLKLTFHKNHVNQNNIYNQVGLIAVVVLGDGLLGPSLLDVDLSKLASSALPPAVLQTASQQGGTTTTTTKSSDSNSNNAGLPSGMTIPSTQVAMRSLFAHNQSMVDILTSGRINDEGYTGPGNGTSQPSISPKTLAAVNQAAHVDETDTMDFLLSQDPVTFQTIMDLKRLKARAIESEHYIYAGKLTEAISMLTARGREIGDLTREKAHAVELEKFEKAEALKMKIASLRGQLEDKSNARSLLDWDSCIRGDFSSQKRGQHRSVGPKPDTHFGNKQPLPHISSTPNLGLPAHEHQSNQHHGEFSFPKRNGSPHSRPNSLYKTPLPPITVAETATIPENTTTTRVSSSSNSNKANNERAAEHSLVQEPRQPHSQSPPLPTRSGSPPLPTHAPGKASDPFGSSIGEFAFGSSSARNADEVPSRFRDAPVQDAPVATASTVKGRKKAPARQRKKENPKPNAKVAPKMESATGKTKTSAPVKTATTKSPAVRGGLRGPKTGKTARFGDDDPAKLDDGQRAQHAAVGKCFGDDVMDLLFAPLWSHQMDGMSDFLSGLDSAVAAQGINLVLEAGLDVVATLCNSRRQKVVERVHELCGEVLRRCVDTAGAATSSHVAELIDKCALDLVWRALETGEKGKSVLATVDLMCRCNLDKALKAILAPQKPSIMWKKGKAQLAVVSMILEKYNVVCASQVKNATNDVSLTAVVKCLAPLLRHTKTEVRSDAIKLAARCLKINATETKASWGLHKINNANVIKEISKSASTA